MPANSSTGPSWRKRPRRRAPSWSARSCSRLDVFCWDHSGILRFFTQTMFTSWWGIRAWIWTRSHTRSAEGSMLVEADVDDLRRLLADEKTLEAAAERARKLF